MLDKCYSIMWMSYHTKGICSSEVHAWFKNFLERGEGYRDMKREHIQNLDFYLCVLKILIWLLCCLTTILKGNLYIFVFCEKKC